MHLQQGHTCGKNVIQLIAQQGAMLNNWLIHCWDFFFHYGKTMLWFQKGFTEVAVIIQKAGIPKALQVGFPPMDPQGSAWRLCQLYPHCVYNAVYQTQHEGGECFESICKLCSRYGNLEQNKGDTQGKDAQESTCKMTMNYLQWLQFEVRAV